MMAPPAGTAAGTAAGYAAGTDEDLYPTRYAPMPPIVPRRDPTLHGGASAPGPLARDRLLAFERDGFLFFDRFFGADEVAALNAALRDALAADPRTIVFGEDVGALGGVFRVAGGLQTEFGRERVFGPPLAEAGIAGIRVGRPEAGGAPRAARRRRRSA